MTLSELIRILSEHKTACGNLPVRLCIDDGFETMGGVVETAFAVSRRAGDAEAFEVSFKLIEGEV